MLERVGESHGHSWFARRSTTLENYAITIPAAPREAVENLSVFVDQEWLVGQLGEDLPLVIEQFNKINGRHDWTRTSDLYRVKVAL